MIDEALKISADDMGHVADNHSLDDESGNDKGPQRIEFSAKLIISMISYLLLIYLKTKIITNKITK